MSFWLNSSKSTETFQPCRILCSSFKSLLFAHFLYIHAHLDHWLRWTSGQGPNYHGSWNPQHSTVVLSGTFLRKATLWRKALQKRFNLAETHLLNKSWRRKPEESKWIQKTIFRKESEMDRSCLLYFIFRSILSVPHHSKSSRKIKGVGQVKGKLTHPPPSLRRLFSSLAQSSRSFWHTLL